MKKSQLLNFFRVVFLLLIFSAFSSTAYAVKVYFDNTLTNWSAVHVYVRNESMWNGDNGVTTKNATYFSMTRIGSTNVWECDVNVAFTHICFVKDRQDNYDNIWNTQAAYYGNFNSSTPKLTPADNNENRNGTKYFNGGSWSVYSAGTDDPVQTLPTSKGNCERIEIYSKDNYNLYVFKDSHIGPDWGSTKKGESVTYNGSSYYKWTICDNEYVHIIFQNGDRSKQSGDSPKLYGGYAYIFDGEYVSDSRPVPNPSSFEEVNCSATGSCYNSSSSGDEEDDYMEALECDPSNTKIIFFENFGTFSDEKDRASSEYSKSGTGFTAKVPTTSYTAMTASCTAIKYAGYYAVLANPFYAGCGEQGQGDTHACECNDSQWYQNIQDHTEGDTNGGMLFYNCRDGKSQTDILYESTVDVCPNTYINFSAFIASATAENRGCSVKAKVRFILYDATSNEELSRYTTDYIPLEEGKWEKIAVMFNSKSTNKVTLKLLNLAEEGCGNDLLLDDITFSVCTPEASMLAKYKNKEYDKEVDCITGEDIRLESTVNEKVFTGTPYYLWQKSEDAVSWTTITEVSGVGKADYEKLEAPTKTTYYRVVVANNETEAINGATKKETICGLYSVTDPIKVIPQNLELTATKTRVICANESEPTTIELSVKNPLTTAVNDVKVNVTDLTNFTVTQKSGGNGTYKDGVWTISMIAANSTAKVTLELKDYKESISNFTDININSFVNSIGSEITYGSFNNAPEISRKTSKITINSVPTAKFEIASEDICNGSSTTKTKISISNGSPDYTLTIEGATYTATTSPYLLEVNPTSTKTYTLEKVMDSRGCSSVPISSNTVTVKVEEIKIIEQPKAITICAGEGAEFSVTTKDADTYQWEECLENKDTNIDSNWSPILGETDNTLSLSNLTLDDNGKRYRVKVWKDEGMCDAIHSEPALLTVNDCSNFSISYLNKLGGTSTKLCLDQDTTLVFSVTNYSQEVDEISDVVVRIEGISDLKLLKFEPNDSKYDHANGVWIIDKISKGPVGKGTTVTLAVKIKGNVTKPSNFYTEAYISEYNGVEYEYEKAVKSNHRLEIQAISGKPLIVDFPYAACSQKEGNIDLKSQIKDKTDIDTKIGTLTFYKDDKVTPLPPVSKQNTSLNSVTTNYYVTNRESEKCVSEPVEGKVIVYGTPTATLSETPSICSNSSAELHLKFEGETKDGSLKYDVTLSDGTTETFTVSEEYITVTPKLTSDTDYPTKFTYELTEVKNIYGCSATLNSSATVTVNSAPSITINADGNLPADICAGKEYILPTVNIDNNGEALFEETEGWYLVSSEGEEKISLVGGKYTFDIDDKGKKLVYKAENKCGKISETLIPELNVDDCAKALKLTYSIEKTEYCAGETITLIATLENNTDIELNDVVISQSSDYVLTAVEENGISKPIFDPSVDPYDSVNKEYIWEIPKLEAYASKTLTITFKATNVNVEEFKIYVVSANSVTYPSYEVSVAKDSKRIKIQAISGKPLIVDFPYAACSQEEGEIDLKSQIKDKTDIGTDIGTLSFYKEDKVTPLSPVSKKNTSLNSVTTNYYVTNTETDKCVSEPVEGKVIVYGTPTATLSKTPSICSNYSAELHLKFEGETKDGSLKYDVTLSDGTTETFTVSEADITVTPNLTSDTDYPTVFTYELTEVKNIYGCSATLNSSATVTVNSAPAITFGVDGDLPKVPEAICAGKEYILPTVNIDNNGEALFEETEGWYLVSSEGEEKISLVGGKYTFDIDDKGKKLVYKVENKCGKISETLIPELNVEDCGEFDFTYVLDKSNVCIGDEVILTATLTNKSGVDLKDIKLSQSWNNQLIASKDANEEPKAIFVTIGDATPGYDANISEFKNLWVINTLENNESVTLTTTFSAQKGDTFHIYMTESNGVDYEDNEQNPARKTQYLTVETIPVVSLSATDVTLNCTTPTATITASGASTYEWSYLDQTGATQTKSGATLALQQTDPDVSSLVTEYTVYGYSKNANCKSVDAKTVKVTEDFVKPVVDIKISETADGTIPERLDCYQQNIKLEADLTNNKETIVEYIWSSGSDNNTTLINNPGTYTLQVKGENGCISDVATETIEQNIVKPEVSIESYITDSVTGNIIPTVELTCANNEITLEGTITNADQYAEDYPNGEFTYLWSDGSTTSSTVAKTPLAISPMEYTLIVTSPNGCLNEVDKAKVTVTENVSAPVLNIESVYKLCPSDTLSVKALSSLLPKTAGVTYKFYDEAGVEIDDFYGASSENPVSTYYVVGTSENGCSSEKVSFDVDFAKNVDFTLTTSQTSMLVGGNETLVTIVPNEDSEVADTYTWLSNGKDILVEGLEYSANLYLDTKFEVTATNRCDTDTQEASVEVLWPTAFTPHNGNGKNDDFAKGMHIIVFNRFYTKIFEGPDGWDGTINGAMNESESIAVPGVYYYSVQLPNGEVKKGTIEIVR